jgi:hypothetical protein
VKISSYRGEKEHFGRSVAHLSIITGIFSTIFAAVGTDKNRVNGAGARGESNKLREKEG